MEKQLTEKQIQDSNFIMLISILMAFLAPFFITLPVYLWLQMYYKKHKQTFMLQRIWLVTFIYGMVGIVLNVFIIVFILAIAEHPTYLSFVPIIVVLLISTLIVINSLKFRNPINEKHPTNT